MADNGSKTLTLDAATREFTSTESSLTSMVMSSRRNVSDMSAPWTTGMMTSSHVVTSLSAMSDALNVSESGHATSANSAALLPNNSSFVLKENDTAVDLKAENIANFLSLMPTIVYLIVLMAVGLVGNAVVFLVYYRRFKPSATRTYVLAMSICDFLANALSLPSEILDIRYTYTFDFPWPCKSIRFLNSFLTLTSAFVLVAVATDRFQKICQPLVKQRPLRTTRLYVAICVLASVALSLVYGALNGSQSLPIGVGNSTGITCSVSDEFVDTLFPLMYTVIMGLAFLACVVIMTMSYIFIALQLWRHKKNQERASGVGLVIKATPVARYGQTHRAIVDDTSSGPVHDSHHSEARASSSAELIPLKNASSPAGSAVNSGTQPAGGSEKQVLLLSIHNFNYEGPVSSVEDSDEGCFSACSMNTTCTSGEISKEGQAQNGEDLRTHSALGSVHTQTVTEEAEKENQPHESETEPTSAKAEATGSAQCTVSDIKSQENSGPDQSSSNPDRDDPAESADAQTIQPADDSLATHHRNAGGRSPSLLQTLLTSKSSHSDGRRDVKKSTRVQVARKRSTVKAIPSSTTLMMFVLTATFIINYLPHLIIIVMRALSSTQFQFLTGAPLNAYNIGLRSYFMNCAVNSLVYGFCSARFRQECLLLFSRK